MTNSPSSRLRSVLLTVFGWFAFAPMAWAAVGNPEYEALRQKYSLEDPFGGVSVPQLIGRIIAQGLPLVGALFLLVFIWSGVLWLTAGGDKGKVEKAIKNMKNAIIGITIVVCAYMIVSVLLNFGSTLTSAGTATPTK